MRSLRGDAARRAGDRVIAVAASVSRSLALLRGAAGRCPNCGKGRLLHRYLETTESCSTCHERYGHLRADDAPPWLTVILVGHLIVPSILILEHRIALTLWVELSLWVTLTLALTLALLPRCKGLVLALLWSTKAEGSERLP